MSEVRARLDRSALDFVLSLHDGEPDFGVLGYPEAAHLPAVRWKVVNVRRFREENPGEHARQRELLEALGS